MPDTVNTSRFEFFEHFKIFCDIVPYTSLCGQSWHKQIQRCVFMQQTTFRRIKVGFYVPKTLLLHSLNRKIIHLYISFN